MLNPRQSEEEGAPSNAPSPALGRRNLPRASQACQMCRIKKARCNQRQPCSNCYRHAFNCVYSARVNGRMRSGTSRHVETPGGPDEERESRERTNHLQSEQISDLPEPQSQNGTNIIANVTDSRPEVLNMDEPMRSTSASEEDPRHVSNGKCIFPFNILNLYRRLCAVAYSTRRWRR